jgi:hypothetical protein
MFGDRRIGCVVSVEDEGVAVPEAQWWLLAIRPGVVAVPAVRLTV